MNNASIFFLFCFVFFSLEYLESCHLGNVISVFWLSIFLDSQPLFRSTSPRWIATSIYIPIHVLSFLSQTLYSAWPWLIWPLPHHPVRPNCPFVCDVVSLPILAMVTLIINVIQPGYHIEYSLQGFNVILTWESQYKIELQSYLYPFICVHKIRTQFKMFLAL